MTDDVSTAVNINIRGDEFEHGRALREMAKAIREAQPREHWFAVSPEGPWCDDAGMDGHADHEAAEACADSRGWRLVASVQRMPVQAGDVCCLYATAAATAQHEAAQAEAAAARVAAERAQWVGWTDGDLFMEVDRRQVPERKALAALEAARAAWLEAIGRVEDVQREQVRRSEVRVVDRLTWMAHLSACKGEWQAHWDNDDQCARCGMLRSEMRGGHRMRRGDAPGGRGGHEHGRRPDGSFE